MLWQRAMRVRSHRPLVHAPGRPAAGPLFALVLLVAGCNTKPAEKLPEWSAAEHEQPKGPTPGQVAAGQPRPGMPDLTRHGIDDVVLATWKQTCTPCHGLIGRGDGPQGAVLHPTDLTSAVWQARAIDSEIAYTIHHGRGRMPGFAHIPEATVAGLVRLVRMLGPAAPTTPEQHLATDGATKPKPPDSKPAH